MILLAALLVTSIQAHDVEMRIGNETTWRRVAFAEVPHPNEMVTLRADVDLTPLERAPFRPLGLYIGAMAAHEVWWDGVLIGRAGVVGRTAEEEVPGPVESRYQIPDALASRGVHRIEIRASAFHRGFTPRNGYWAVIIADYDRLVTAHTSSAHAARVALSGIGLTAVFAFAMFWLTRRDRSFLLLGTLCLSAAALLICESWRAIHGYTYDWHIVRLRGVVALSWLVGVQLVGLLVTRFPHRHGRRVLGATALVAAIVPWIPRGWDAKALAIFVVCCAAAFAWAVFAAARRLHGSTLALTGAAALVLTLLANPWRWLDDRLYLALLFLLVCLLCSHALEVRREHQQKERLQLEIMRRHMQPHFLMNTLTALSEWIEQEPKTAVKMIDSLADELHSLAEMSARSLVAAGKELTLCRAHLTNMSLRRDVAYELEVEGVDPASLIPPAVIHTLVENAITHAPVASRVVMRLTSAVARGRRTYVFESPAAAPAREFERDSREGGSGTRYIEARLREAWGTAWRFEQALIGDRWRAELEVPA